MCSPQSFDALNPRAVTKSLLVMALLKLRSVTRTTINFVVMLFLFCR